MSVGIGCLAIEEVVQDVVELYYSCSIYLLVSAGPVVMGGDINEQDLLIHASVEQGAPPWLPSYLFALCCASVMLMGCSGQQELRLSQQRRRRQVVGT